MKKGRIPLSKLTSLTQDAGEKLLFEAGYIQDDAYCDESEYITGDIYHDDVYYHLYDENGKEVDQKSWTTLYEKAKETIDDLRDDHFIKSYWDCMYERK